MTDTTALRQAAELLPRHGNHPTCPRCSSHRVNQDTTQTRPWTRYFTCVDCGHQWGAAA